MRSFPHCTNDKRSCVARAIFRRSSLGSELSYIIVFGLAISFSLLAPPLHNDILSVFGITRGCCHCKRASRAYQRYARIRWQLASLRRRFQRGRNQGKEEFFLLVTRTGLQGRRKSLGIRNTKAPENIMFSGAYCNLGCGDRI